MQQTFFVSDLHLSHKNIIVYEKDLRPFSSIEEHDAEIIKRWNNTVRSCDRVWIIGDLVINPSALEKVNCLNGTKYLVMGNHDSFSRNIAKDVLFNVVENMFGSSERKIIGNKCLLTHIPVIREQFSYRYDFNLHGHLHHHKVMRTDYSQKEDLRYINLSMEHWNLTPVHLDELAKEISRRKLLMNEKYYKK